MLALEEFGNPSVDRGVGHGLLKVVMDEVESSENKFLTRSESKGESWILKSVISLVIAPKNVGTVCIRTETKSTMRSIGKASS